MAREVNSKDDICGYGCGYDYKADDYKLVRVVIDWDSECSHVDVYTSVSNSWKITKSIPYHLDYQGALYFGLLFNGALHWLAHTFGKDSYILVCFDVVSEGFKEVAMPISPIPYPEEDMFHVSVGELGECPCLVFHVRVDVWMMQEYGVGKSWTKSFSITEECIP
ncbi:F-box/kelch-repeat protein At3g06240-like [Papaver somniferum]|uniref:F-box/kelch-repeat protein At3g06240-like n=1 Tax=Papaver somniferum TaxID=3469 RepID=UPI000E70246F|nr:F-box/kelch-repeat protein At3g06240-like [Papaver somniferum]